jgi:hypothetical protein
LSRQCGVPADVVGLHVQLGRVPHLPGRPGEAGLHWALGQHHTRHQAHAQIISACDTGAGTFEQIRIRTSGTSRVRFLVLRNDPIVTFLINKCHKYFCKSCCLNFCLMNKLFRASAKELLVKKFAKNFRGQEKEKKSSGSATQRLKHSV